MIAIVDYGIGNLRSIEKAFEAVGADVVRSDRPEDIRRADKVVLPGVGAFGACIDEIRRRGLEKPILDAIGDGKSFLGVCVGMQLLFESSEEMGRHEGLGVLPGRVRRFQAGRKRERGGKSPGNALKIPHMGWNTVEPQREDPLLRGLPSEPYFYFVHSYAAAPDRASDMLATCRHGVVFPAVVQRNNVSGVQFHPEKSQANGLRILRNFAESGERLA